MQNEIISPSFESDKMGQVEINSLKSILALMHGKRDSVTKVYYQTVIISTDSIVSLDEQICKKLQNNQVGEIVTSVDISTKKRKIMSFSGINDFSNYNWNLESDKLDNIIIKWDFFILFPNYKMPQRHTISIKLSGEPSPREILSAMLADTISDLDNIETSFALTICRVDFINNILAEEIINIVTNWLDLLDKSDVQKSLYVFLRKHDRTFARLFDIFVIVGLSLMGMIAIKMLYPYIDIDNAEFIVYTFTATLCLGYIFSRLGRLAGGKLIDAINNTGSYHMFLITNGDKKEETKLKEKRREKGAWFWFFLGILIDLLLGITFACFF